MSEKPIIFPKPFNFTELTCPCVTPRTCISSVTVEAPMPPVSKKFEQLVWIKDIYQHDVIGAGVDVTIELKPKVCSTSNLGCPAGVFYCQETGEIHAFVAGKHTITAHPTSVLNYTFWNFLDDLFSGRLPILTATRYILLIYDCNGKPSPCPLIDVSKVPPTSTASIATSSNLYIYPKYEWKIGCTLAFQREKRFKGIPPELVTSGNASLVIGSITNKFESVLGKNLVLESFGKSKFLSQISSLADLPQKFVKSQSSANFPTTCVELILPKLELTGAGKINSSNPHKFFMSGELVLGFSPLIEFDYKVDVIQLAAAYCKLSAASTAIRSAQQKAEEKFKTKPKKSSLFVGEHFYIIFGLKLSTSFAINTTNKKDWKVSLKEGTSLTTALVIKAEVQIRAGARVSIAGGLYKGETELEAGARAVTEGCCTLQAANAGGFDVILHHEGIWVEVQVKGVVKLEVEQQNTAKSGLFGKAVQKTLPKSVEHDLAVTKLWQIYSPCSKDSGCKVTILK